MFNGFQIEKTLRDLDVTHVVWLPDTAIGQWEAAFEQSTAIQLVRICREGEAWGVAAGLYIGGKRPIVMIQNTGLFESGDALRNILLDMKLPIYAIIGYRNYLVENSPDSARRFTEPVLTAWGLDYILLDGEDALGQLANHYRECQTSGQAGIALLPE